MTNERKILILKDIQKNYIFGTEPWDVLDMEIKALSQEPTYYPPCIDCNKKMDEIRRAYDKLKEQEQCNECRNKRTSFCGNCKEYDEYEPCDDAEYRVV